MDLKEILSKTTVFFKDKKIDNPRLDAELLLAHGLKLERIQLYLRFDQPMKDEELNILRDLVRRRATGEPMAYILGYRDFFKHRFFVTPAVLIPRPETEHLVEAAVEWALSKSLSQQAIGLIDLGCGSGCIGLSLLKEWPEARLLAVDISEEALKVAAANAKVLGVEDRVKFLHVNGGNSQVIISHYQEFCGKERVDVLVSNPPYISSDDLDIQENVKKFEPASALFAEDQGLALLKEWSTAYGSKLQGPGIMLMEMGTTQGSAMTEHFQNLKIFDEVDVVKDIAGHDRIIRGVIHG